MSIVRLKKELKKFPKEELESLVMDLYTKSKDIKEYLAFFLDPDEAVLLEKYRLVIGGYMYPKRGQKPRIAKAKAALRQFGRIYALPYIEAELMYTFILKGFEFHQNAHPSKTTTDSILMMGIALNAFLTKNNLVHSFENRIDRLEVITQTLIAHKVT